MQTIKFDSGLLTNSTVKALMVLLTNSTVKALMVLLTMNDIVYTTVVSAASASCQCCQP